MIKQIPVLFCKYLVNESSDLYEILFGGQLLSKVSNFMTIHAQMRVVNMRAHVLLRVRAFTRPSSDSVAVTMYKLKGQSFYM